MSGATAPGVADLAAQVLAAEPPLDADDRALALAVLRALARGAAASTEELAHTVGLPVEAVDEWLRTSPHACAAQRDDRGRVTGFGGLSLTPTPHALDLGGRRLYAWCAWDPLFLVPLLGGSGRVTASCPATGRTLRLAIGADGAVMAEPSTMVLSFTSPSACGTPDVRERFCSFVSFFADTAAAARYTVLHPGTFVLSVAEGARLAHLVNERRFGPAAS